LKLMTSCHGWFAATNARANLTTPTKANMVQGEDQRILRAEDCCLN
jgi:hypothetical protein